MNHKVIISLTTIPERLLDEKYIDCGILSCLNSLLNQNYLNYKVQLNVPYIYELNQKKYEIPKHVHELTDLYSNFYIHRCKDFGPPTKIVPTIESNNESDSILIVVDDDFVYHPEMINDHLFHMSKHPDSCIAYDGMNVIGQKFEDGRDRFATFLYRDAEVSIVQHYKSVSYKRSWFKDDLFTDFVGKSRSDDIVISAYMGKHGINRVIPHSKFDDEIKGSSFDFESEWMEKLSTLSFPIVKQACSIDNVGTKDPLALQIEDRFFCPPEFDLYLNHDSINRCNYRLPHYTK